MYLYLMLLSPDEIYYTLILVRTLSVEWAANGVRVNSVAPGVIYSLTAEASYGFNIFEGLEEYLPTRRLGNPDEVSSAVCFLLSPGLCFVLQYKFIMTKLVVMTCGIYVGASFITGANLRIDGGGSLYSRLMIGVESEYLRSLQNGKPMTN
jgi:NAD(P)-dependent dehydrogenase (short-subunit alcohol dehydrogenase family)